MLRLLIVCSLLVFSCFSPLAAQSASPQGLHFSTAQWAYDVRDRDDYDLNTDDAFPRGQRAYAYLELVGFEMLEQDGYYLLQLGIDVALKTTWGLTLFNQPDLLEFDSFYLRPPDDLWFYIWVDIPRWAPPSTYITLITVRDLISGQTLEEAREIRIF